MPIGIRVYDAPKNEPGATCIEIIWGHDMAQAEASAIRWAQHHDLAGPGPDRTVYAYDCLGGLRFEARRRNDQFTLKSTTKGA